MKKNLFQKKTKQFILSTIVEKGNYKELKKALIKQPTEYILIKKLALAYIENILQLNLYITQTKEDFYFLSSKDINELVFEYYAQTTALIECLIECVNIIELKKTLKDCIVKTEIRINDCEYNLYPGFLCSQKSIQEVSILYSILKEFKQKITDIE